MRLLPTRKASVETPRSVDFQCDHLDPDASGMSITPGFSQQNGRAGLTAVASPRTVEGAKAGQGYTALVDGDIMTQTVLSPH